MATPSQGRRSPEAGRAGVCGCGYPNHLFVLRPVQAMLERRRRELVEEGMPDKERRHQELLAALRTRS
jgi:hypothetical protein